MMNSNLPPHPFVFFSYSSEDRALVMRLESDLQSYRVNAWTDENLRAGMNLREQIEKAIQAADAVLLFPPSHARSSSSRTHDELQIAHAYHRSVLSLPASRTAVSESLPSQTRLKASADRDETRYEQILSSIVQQLTALGLVESHSNSSTSSALTSNETSSSEIHEADYDRVMTFFEELEPHYSKTNQILADL